MALADTEHVLDYTELKRLIASKNQHNKKNQHATHTHSSTINSISNSSSIVLDAKGGSKSQSTIPHSASGSLHHHSSSCNNNNSYTTALTATTSLKHTATNNKLLLPSTKSTKRYPISTTHRPNSNLTSSPSSSLHKSTPSRRDPLPRLGSSLDYQNSSILLDDEGSVDTYTGHNYDHNHNNLYTNSTTSISYKNDNDNGSMVNDTPLLRKMAKIKGVEAMTTYNTYYTLYNNNNNNNTTTANNNSRISLEDSMDMKGHNYDQVINMLGMNSNYSDPQSDDDGDKNTTANYTKNNKHNSTTNNINSNSSMSNSSLLMSKSLQRLIDARNLYY